MAEKRVEAVTEIDAVHTNKTKKTMSIQQNRYRKIQFRVCRNVCLNCSYSIEVCTSYNHN